MQLAGMRNVLNPDGPADDGGTDERDGALVLQHRVSRHVMGLVTYAHMCMLPSVALCFKMLLGLLPVASGHGWLVNALLL